MTTSFLWLLFSAATFAQDADGDGVDDALDACPGQDDRIDHDFDGVPNGCELQPVGATWQWRIHRFVPASYSTGLTALDVDIDGDLDLVRAFANGIEVLDNLGGFTFGSAQSVYARGGYISSIDLVDVDSDGDLDLLYVDSSSGTVASLENLCGALARGPIVGMGIEMPGQAAAADFDSDGDLDVAVTSSVSGPWVFERTPSGFAPGVLGSSTSVSSWAVDVADLDTDGDDDLLVGEWYAPGDLYWLEWSAWTFQSHLLATTSAATLYDGVAFSGVCAADFTADGEIDVMAAEDDVISMFRNLGGGASWTHVVVSTGLDQAHQLIPDDVDGDGDVDVMTASYTGLAWLRNDSPGFVEVPVPTTTGAFYGQMVYDDLDNDGIRDLGGVSLNSDETEVLAGLGAGTYATAFVDQTPTVERPEGLAYGDIDGDGLDDLVLTGSAGDRLMWHRNLSGGAFDAAQDLVVGRSSLVRVLADDTDGDGDTDVIAGSEGGGILWLEALGAGVFAPPVEYETSVPTHGLELADLDGDGTPDLVAVGWDWATGLVRWYRHDGAGWVLQSDIATAGYLVVDSATGDLDGDGDIDVAWISGDDGAYWSENLGGGVFAAAVLVDVVSSSFSHAGIEAADFDLDGDLDLAWTAPSYAGHVLSVAENLGGGTFSAAVEIDPSVPPPLTLVAEDLDADGVQDLILGAATQFPHVASVWIYRGDGAGGFEPRMDLSHLGTEVMQVVAHDADQDGDLDLTYGSNFEHEVVWIENPLIDPPDGDGDGLYEDEELLRGLDPLDPDSDGDGISDGAEVFGQGGPTIPGGTGATTPTPPGLSPCAPASGSGTGTGTGTGSTGTPTTPGTTTGTSTGTADTAAPRTDAGDKGGCGCSSAETTPGGFLVGISVFGLGYRRRRRRWGRAG